MIGSLGARGCALAGVGEDARVGAPGREAGGRHARSGSTVVTAAAVTAAVPAASTSTAAAPTAKPAVARSREREADMRPVDAGPVRGVREECKETVRPAAKTPLRQPAHPRWGGGRRQRPRAGRRGRGDDRRPRAALPRERRASACTSRRDGARPSRRSSGCARPRSCSTSACPGMDGLEVCRALRARGDWTPVVFVTARDDEVDRILGLELGADDYLTKPFSPRELVARVKRAGASRGGPVGAGGAPVGRCRARPGAPAGRRSPARPSS